MHTDLAPNHCRDAGPVVDIANTNGPKSLGNKRIKTRSFAILILACLAALSGIDCAQLASGQNIRLLHSFTGGTGGNGPFYFALVIKDSTLYGTTLAGGMAPGGGLAKGMVFSVETDGSGFRTLHSFVGGIGGSTDGVQGGSLLLDGSTLYGLTGGGGTGPHAEGTLYSIEADGSRYRQLDTFSGPPCEGTAVRARLAQCGATLFGASATGGANRRGAVFSVRVNGSRYRLLHSFGGNSIEGGPQADLLRIGSTLYGTTGYSPVDFGTVYSINTDGSCYRVLCRFLGTPADGSNPFGLTSIGATLYGVTDGVKEGVGVPGTIFSINADGSGFRRLHQFVDPINGETPTGGLTARGSVLYGVATGGVHSKGCIFSINADGSGFQVVHSFAGEPNDGAQPGGYLTVSGSTLYGTSDSGGEMSQGAIFAITLRDALSATHGSR